MRNRRCRNCVTQVIAEAVGSGQSASVIVRRHKTIGKKPVGVDRWRAALPPVRTMNEIAADYIALYEELLRERAVA